jgi:hypothetical protein
MYKGKLLILLFMNIFDPPNPREISVFSEFDLYRLILTQTLDTSLVDCVFLGLVRKRPKNVCSISNDYKEKKRHDTPKKNAETRKTPAKARKS